MIIKPAVPVQVPRVRRVVWPLIHHPASVPQARRLVRSQLAVWGLADCSDVAELLTSELLTNALRHGWGNPILTLSWQDGTLRCQVQDANPALPHISPPHPDGGGQGLRLVDQLSCSWGSDRASVGKLVWFELPTHPGRPADG